MNQNTQKNRPQISILVTDLDNTLWNWFDIWYGSFKPFLDELVRETKIPEAILKSEIKLVHEHHRTCEYSHVLEELPCLQARYGMHFDATEKLPTVVKAFRDGRRNTSSLYPGVSEALRAIKSNGTVIVGFTESQFYYTAQRIQTLGLDGILNFLYTTEDSGSEQLRLERTKSGAFDGLKQTKTVILPTHATKPDATLLLSILEDFSFSKRNSG